MTPMVNMNNTNLVTGVGEKDGWLRLRLLAVSRREVLRPAACNKPRKKRAGVQNPGISSADPPFRTGKEM